MRYLPATIFLFLPLLAGCVSLGNPSFSLDASDAKKELRERRETPHELERPLVILGGWLDPGFVVGDLRKDLGRIFDSDEIIAVPFAFMPSFDACRDKTIAAVDRAFPTDDPARTTEVDVIGFSMGGLVARYAAIPEEGHRQLRIRRLFTISTPHRGARMADLPTLDDLVIDMRPGSAFLVRLDEALAVADYELTPYVRLDDWIVGPENAAPPDQKAWWVPNRPFQMAHNQAAKDPRILADIIRRLCREEPHTSGEPAPLPE